MITKLKKVLISSNGSLEENFVTFKERFKFNYATSEEVLYTLTDKHPIVAKIMDYKALRKLKSIYVDALPQLINNKNGLIHTSYNHTKKYYHKIAEKLGVSSPASLQEALALITRLDSRLGSSMHV